MQWTTVLMMAVVAAGASASFRQRLECSRLLAPKPAALLSYFSAMGTCLRDKDIFQSFAAALKENVAEFEVSDLLSLDASSVLSSDGDKFAELLEFLNLSDEVTQLRRCMAGETGNLTEDGEFDTAGYSASILDKVAGSSVEENVREGVENCGQVENFKVYLYLECISDYCTGEK